MAVDIGLSENFHFDITFDELLVYDLKKVKVETVRLEHFFYWTGQAPSGWIFWESSAELVQPPLQCLMK